MIMPKLDSKEIELFFHYSRDKEEVQGRLVKWVENVYCSILEDLNKGKIPPILFEILNEEEFIKCFGQPKINLDNSKDK